MSFPDRSAGVTDFPASNAPASDALSGQFFLDELSKVPVLHAICNTIRGDFPLYPHNPDPRRDRLFDLRDQSGRLVCPVRLILSGPPVFVKLGSRCYETGIDLEHVGTMGGINPELLECGEV